jgi:hypothetical protein
LRAPDAATVTVSDDFADGPQTMTGDADGTWTTIVGPLRPALYNYIYCGKKDTLFASNQSFHQLLDQRKIAHTFVESEGAHVWTKWRDYLVDFAPRLFR